MIEIKPSFKSGQECRTGKLSGPSQLCLSEQAALLLSNPALPYQRWPSPEIDFHFFLLKNQARLNLSLLVPILNPRRGGLIGTGWSGSTLSNQGWPWHTDTSAEANPRGSWLLGGSGRWAGSQGQKFFPSFHTLLFPFFPQGQCGTERLVNP